MKSAQLSHPALIARNDTRDCLGDGYDDLVSIG